MVQIPLILEVLRTVLPCIVRAYNVPHLLAYLTRIYYSFKKVCPRLTPTPYDH